MLGFFRKCRKVAFSSKSIYLYIFVIFVGLAKIPEVARGSDISGYILAIAKKKPTGGLTLQFSHEGIYQFAEVGHIRFHARNASCP